VFVFSDSAAAADAHRRAHAHQECRLNGSLPYSDDAGPQLLSGYGASAWRRNVAVVQTTRLSFGLLMPAEPDCAIDVADATSAAIRWPDSGRARPESTRAE
jgi:hypothetical protein